jgi:DNA (cytosine-5)-methyltransferase 1
MKEPMFIVVDLFCGFGGTTRGFILAKLQELNIAKVIACINHDKKAIKSHWLSNPDVKHFEEDIRTLDLTELIRLVEYYRALYPNAKLILWASLECTNFSRAKGGQPRNADSRTLADHLERYVKALDPDYIQIENVVEFMSWGPLDENGRPVSRKNGEDWMRWRKMICEHGYVDEWKELNSANFGAYTSRNRLFGIFAKPWLPIAWPSPTHAKNPGKGGMFEGLQKWKAVKEVLHFHDEGESILTREKDLSDKTLERIYAGLVKYVAKGDTSFLSKYYSGFPGDKNIPVEGPADTITTIDHHSLVQASFICQRNGGSPDSKIVDLDGPARAITSTGGNQDLVQANFLLQTYAADSKGHNTFPVDKPARTITTRDSTQLVSPEFLAHYYGQGGQHSSVDKPAPTIPTKARSALVQPEFLTIYNGKSLHRSVTEPCPVIATNDRFNLVQPQFLGNAQNQSVDEPAGAILTNDKHRLVNCEPFIMPTNFSNQPKSIHEPAPTITADRHATYIVNPSHGGHVTSTDAPCPVIIARQDKAPLYLVSCQSGQMQVAVYESDSPAMVKIKQFMAAYQIVDIKMRMLRVGELLKIQGFPENTPMVGNQADQKKFIGNSVVPLVVKVWIEAIGARLLNQHQKVA